MVTRQARKLPALRMRTRRPPTTNLGLTLVVVVPSPSWPTELAPQQKASPFVVSGRRAANAFGGAAVVQAQSPSRALASSSSVCAVRPSSPKASKDSGLSNEAT